MGEPETPTCVRRYEVLPSAAEFASAIESSNFPAAFSGCVKDWIAFTKWNPQDGGLDYLQEKAGSCIVETMLSRTDSVFYGDLRSHERVPLPFSSFIDICKKYLQKVNASLQSDCNSDRGTPEGVCINEEFLAYEDAPQRIYSAQVPILNMEKSEQSQLDILKEDIETPAILSGKSLASVNLWMNIAEARSSTHYDPHHNLLCIVSGRKKVVLWPPCASPFLYPMSIYGEASNHCSVSVENPDFSAYPRSKHLMTYSQKVILNAGDVLFIPEGWFHQVDSDNLTMAVNFWWQSDLVSSMLEHMDSYYLRRTLRRLIDKETNLILRELTSDAEDSPKCAIEATIEVREGNSDEVHKVVGDSSEENHVEEKSLGYDLEPVAVQALHELVSLVHEQVNLNGRIKEMQSNPGKSSLISVQGGDKSILNVEDDRVALILGKTKPHALRSVLLTMAERFPRTLEALVLYLLSPLAAEVLTQKFDQMDHETSNEDRTKFYQKFYGAFDDQFAAMETILRGKESFAEQAYNNVLCKYLGLNLGSGL
ncbi:hypothetical protein MLD38_016025 [Melastoma candidum]|uniref:Uncharacterized protein n=1 Tax=Melastoma candidum TaxID=119954 RepID=A0ACB9RJZ7_9MYRT|nr:hypothetical protein MLD38_016025 [Melastoma candidum]